MNATDKFTILVSRLTLSDEQVEELKIDASYFTEWDILYRKAVQHKVGSFIYYNLTKHNLRHLVPVNLLNNWHAEFIRTSLMNERMMFEVDKLAEVLKDEKIVLLKGAALNINLYPSNGIRFMRDVDILVYKDRRDIIYKKLVDAGWIPYNKDVYKSWIHRKINDVEHKHLSEIHRTEKSAYIEPHWKFFAGTNDDELSKEAMDTAIQWEDNLYIMSDEFMFVHLCSNFTDGYDMGESLRTLCDVHEFMIQKDLNWDEIDRICKDEPLHSRLLTAMNCVRWMFGCEIQDKYKTSEFDGIEPSLDYLASDKIADRNISFKRYVKESIAKCDSKVEVMLLIYKTIVPDKVWLREYYSDSKCMLLSYWRTMLRKLGRLGSYLKG